MAPLYFRFLQTVAAFIVSAIKIDKNKDGTISGAEIWSFVNLNILPLVLNAGTIQGEFQAFADHIKSLGFEGVKKSLMDVVQYQLLPEELAAYEEKIDALLSAIVKTIDGAQETLNAGKDLFGGKSVALKIIKKKAA